MTDATSVQTADWACIRWHESGDNYSEWNGGAYQFTDATWAEFTGLAPPAEDYSAELQDHYALVLYAYAQRVDGDGFEPWTTRWVCGL